MSEIEIGREWEEREGEWEERRQGKEVKKLRMYSHQKDQSHLKSYRQNYLPTRRIRAISSLTGRTKDTNTTRRSRRVSTGHASYHSLQL